jgi:hypothetical protein
MAQVQLTMEVLDLDECDFVQFVPETWYREGVYDVTRVKRDPAWWEKFLPIAKTFWLDVINWRKANNMEVDPETLFVPILYGPEPEPKSAKRKADGTRLPNAKVIDIDAIEGFAILPLDDFENPEEEPAVDAEIPLKKLKKDNDDITWPDVQ